MTLLAGSRLGPYEILAPIGAGGMGEVYRARDARLGREVAIKVLPAEFSSDASRLKRFEREARSASALNHPNIVTIYDIGSSDSAPLRWTIERCLAKEPRNRFASTEDLAGDLVTIRDHLSEATSGVSLAAPRPSRRWVPWLALGIVALAVAAVSLLRSLPPAEQVRAIRFSIPPPPKTVFLGAYGAYQSLAFSRDGSQLAFIATPNDVGSRIWLRPLSAVEDRALPGTEGAGSLFWSPDGRSIGFFGSGKLWRVDLSGGAPVPLCDVRPVIAYAGTWGAGGQILFASIQGEAIYRVSASGGKPAAIVKPDRARGETKVNWPWFLPDGRGFLYHLRQEGSAGSLMFSPPDGPARPLLQLLSRAEYVEPGYLVFVREGTLIAQRFDPRSGTVSGEPFSIADSVRYFLSIGSAHFATGRGGVFAFQARTAPGDRMVWFDRAGRPGKTLGPPGGYRHLAISPDGRRVLFDRQEPKTRTEDLWMFDLERGVETRITSDPNDEFGGVWLPDGKSIVYSADRGGAPQLRRRDLATEREVALLPAGAMQTADDVMPGGAQVACEHQTDRGDFDVELVSLSGDHKSSPLLQSPFTERQVRFSPDGRFVAFISDESGRAEAYIAPIAGVGEKIRISSSGADLLRWSRDGREIFYLSWDDKLVSVPIRTVPTLLPGKPSTLFTVTDSAFWTSFDVSPDGQRFLAIVPEPAGEGPPLTVVVNWTAEARR